MQKGRGRKGIDEFEKVPKITREVSKATIGQALPTVSQEMAQSERCTCAPAALKSKRPVGSVQERDCPYK